MAKNIETVEDMKQALLNNDRILANAVLALYNCQTIDEQSSASTQHDNGVGFNGTDAYILSSFARQIATNKESQKAGTLPAGYGLLSVRQFEIARKKMPKYARQLLNIAASNRGATTTSEPTQSAQVAPVAPCGRCNGAGFLLWADGSRQEPCSCYSTPPVELTSLTTGARYFCCDCGAPAQVMANETSLCNRCQNTRDRIDVEVNRSRHDAYMAKKAQEEQKAREEEEANQRLLSRTACDCGEPVETEFNGLPCCPDCHTTMAKREEGRVYRESRRMIAEEQAGADQEGRPSLLVKEGNTLRFMTPKEQYEAGYKLNLQTGRKFETVKLEELESDPFGTIPAAFVVK